MEGRGTKTWAGADPARSSTGTARAPRQDAVHRTAQTSRRRASSSRQTPVIRLPAPSRSRPRT
eukprot:2145254-Pyramimonas_sp.AAC.1